jgi:hypothetical protein
VFGGQKTEMHKRLRMLESKGYLYRTVGEVDFFAIADRDAARRAVNEKPLPKNGYIKVADRQKPAARRIVNSVWQLGAQ